jgi:hypothetical protein
MIYFSPDLLIPIFIRKSTHVPEEDPKLCGASGDVCPHAGRIGLHEQYRLGGWNG